MFIGSFIFGFSDLHFGLYTLVWGMSMEYDTFIGTSFDTRTARVQCRGSYLPPPPGHTPSARKAVLPGVLCEHMCSY
jgi:hypothetical protein